MTTKLNPGKYDCYARALPDEPYFVLLARDPSAPDLVRSWGDNRRHEINRRHRPESDGAMVHEAYDCARQMEVWRAANFNRWKTEPTFSPPWLDPRTAPLDGSSFHAAYRSAGGGVLTVTVRWNREVKIFNFQGIGCFGRLTPEEILAWAPIPVFTADFLSPAEREELVELEKWAGEKGLSDDIAALLKKCERILKLQAKAKGQG